MSSNEARSRYLGRASGLETAIECLKYLLENQQARPPNPNLTLEKDDGYPLDDSGEDLVIDLDDNESMNHMMTTTD